MKAVAAEEYNMKKILFAGLLSGLLCSPAFAAIKEVIKEATGSGPTQHQAISEALLIAVQSVNGASVSSQMNYEETVSLSVNNQGWTYTGKVSPVFSVANQGSGSVTKFQVLSVSGAKNIVKLLYYPYRIRKKLEIIHRLSRSTILYAYV